MAYYPRHRRARLLHERLASMPSTTPVTSNKTQAKLDEIAARIAKLNGADQ